MCLAGSPKPGLFIRDRPFMDQVLALCPRTIPIWSATKLLCRSGGGCGADEGSYGCDRCERIPALFLWPVEAAQQGGPDRRVCRRDLLNDDVEEIGRRLGEGTQCFKFVGGSSKKYPNARTAVRNRRRDGSGQRGLPGRKNPLRSGRRWFSSRRPGRYRCPDPCSRLPGERRCRNPDRNRRG